jgi:hypothetical protein
MRRKETTSQVECAKAAMALTVFVVLAKVTERFQRPMRFKF